MQCHWSSVSSGLLPEVHEVSVQQSKKNNRVSNEFYYLKLPSQFFLHFFHFFEFITLIKVTQNVFVMFLLCVIMKTSIFVTELIFYTIVQAHTCSHAVLLISFLKLAKNVQNFIYIYIGIEWQKLLACSFGQLVYRIANDLTLYMYVLLLLSSTVILNGHPPHTKGRLMCSVMKLWAQRLLVTVAFAEWVICYGGSSRRWRPVRTRMPQLTGAITWLSSNMKFCVKKVAENRMLFLGDSRICWNAANVQFRAKISFIQSPYKRIHYDVYLSLSSAHLNVVVILPYDSLSIWRKGLKEHWLSCL